MQKIIAEHAETKKRQKLSATKDKEVVKSSEGSHSSYSSDSNSSSSSGKGSKKDDPDAASKMAKREEAKKALKENDCDIVRAVMSLALL